MEKNKEYSVWQETQNLMDKNYIKMSKSFLDKLTATDTSLLDIFFKYKFAAKMIPEDSKILEINCNKGFGAPILGEMSKHYVGFDTNSSFINIAKQTFTKETFSFISY